MEKIGTLKKNGDQKTNFGPHGDQSPQMGTNVGAVYTREGLGALKRPVGRGGKETKTGNTLGFRQLTLLVLSECVADVNNNKDSEAVKDVFHQ